MKKRIAPQTRAHLLRGAFYLLVLLAGTLMMPSFRPEAKAKASNPAVAGLTFAERLAYQRAIEEVYWRHRIWPRNGGENAEPKPSLDAVMSRAQLETKVEDYLRNSQALDDYWQRPITTEQLQAEMDRMARDTKQPDVLRELFSALGNDPFVIAECLARPLLAERLTADFRGQNSTNPFGSAWVTEEPGTSVATSSKDAAYTLPEIPEDIPPCTDDTWTATNLTNAPFARYYHTAVWTGNEMIVWGGYNGSDLDSGGRYTPSTDAWTATSMINVPTARDSHTAVWTGSEMIVFGGFNGSTALNTGGRYNPATNSWISTALSALVRGNHTAVWTGSEMIAWGGTDPVHYLNTGERFNPTTNTWTGTSIANAPAGRYIATAVWTGSEMIVWGGSNTAFFNTGGRYNPSTDTWTATSITGAPVARWRHTAVWTGTKMIVWGGNSSLNTGGRYTPGTDSWTATSTFNVPDGRGYPTSVWTGNEMIVWGGLGSLWVNTGGRYCVQSGPTTPTPTATRSPTPTPTATPTATRTQTPTATATVPSSPTPIPSPTSTGTPTPVPGGTNVALAANGGVASASSIYSSNFPVTAVNDGDRLGLNWGNGGGWADGTANVWPDWVETDFNASYPINEIDFFTLQDNYQSPSPPTLNMTFTLYGVTDLEVQYWTGSTWTDIPGGALTGNNHVWRQFTFASITTDKIRVLINNSLASYSRVTEIEAYTAGANPTPTATVPSSPTPTPSPTSTGTPTPVPGGTNVALAANGGVASASSTYSNNFPLRAVNDGDRLGLNWGNGGGWADGTVNVWPDWVEIDFDASYPINEIDFVTLQDNYQNPSPPTLDMTFTLYGVTDFEVQYWTGSTWTDIPGGDVTGNNHVWRQFTFASMTTAKIRVLINNAIGP